MVSPIGGSNQNQTNSEDNLTNSTNITGFSTEDTISYGSYLAALSEAKTTLKHTLYGIEQGDALVIQRYFLTLAQRAVDIANAVNLKKESLTNEWNYWNTIYGYEQQIQTATNNYNSQIQAARDAYVQAGVNYSNAGGVTADISYRDAFVAALTDYNKKALSLTLAYNQAIKNYNTAIQVPPPEGGHIPSFLPIPTITAFPFLMNEPLGGFTTFPLAFFSDADLQSLLNGYDGTAQMYSLQSVILKAQDDYNAQLSQAMITYNNAVNAFNVASVKTTELRTAVLTAALTYNNLSVSFTQAFNQAVSSYNAALVNFVPPTGFTKPAPATPINISYIEVNTPISPFASTPVIGTLTTINPASYTGPGNVYSNLLTELGDWHVLYTNHLDLSSRIPNYNIQIQGYVNEYNSRYNTYINAGSPGPGDPFYEDFISFINQFNAIMSNINNQYNPTAITYNITENKYLSTGGGATYNDGIQVVPVQFGLFQLVNYPLVSYSNGIQGLDSSQYPSIPTPPTSTEAPFFSLYTQLPNLQAPQVAIPNPSVRFVNGPGTPSVFSVSPFSLGLAVPPSLASFIDDFLSVDEAAAFEAIIQIRSQMDLSKSLLEIKQTSTTQRDITLPPAFYQKVPVVLFDTTTQGGASGKNLNTASATLGLSSPYFEQLLSSSLYQTVAAEDKVAFSADTKDKLQRVTLAVVSQLGLPSAGSVQKIVAQEGLKPPENSNTQSILDAVGFSQSVHALLKSGNIAEIAQKIVNEAPELVNLPAVKKDSFIRKLTAIINLSLLNVASSQLALAIGAPLLPGQLTANTAVANPERALNSAAASIAQVIGNPIAILSIKNATVGFLADQFGLSSEQSLNAANAIINSSLINGGTIENANALREKVIAGAEGFGLEPAVATRLAEEIARLVNTEIGLPFLDRVFRPENLFPLLASATQVGGNNVFAVNSGLLASSLAGQVADGQELQPEIKNQIQRALDAVVTRVPTTPSEARAALIEAFGAQGLPEGKIDSLATSAVAFLSSLRGSTPSLTIADLGGNARNNGVFIGALNAALTQSPQSVRQFRSELNNQLINRGLSPSKAEQLATNTTQLLAPRTSDNPLVTARGHISTAELAESAHDLTLNSLTSEIDVFRARKLADRAVSTLIGPNSILEDYNHQLAILGAQNSERVSDAVTHSSGALSKTSLPQLGLERAIGREIRTAEQIITTYMSPAAAQDIRHEDQRKLPSNFKRGIDIPV